MSNNKIILLFFFICFFWTKTNAQYITVDDTKTPQQLIEKVLVNSSCVTITNPLAFGDEYTPGRKSYASFTSGTSNFPFKEGVILSTGTSRNSIGPFDAQTSGDGGSKLWLGDSDLDQILGIKSINATVLEFDFTPLTNFISFNYIFASNEYQSYFPCQYSDGFAFLIKEKGSTNPYKNLAVLPGTATPVSSMNVHPKIEPVVDIYGNRFDGCPPVNEVYFNGFNTASSPINYAGQTTVMKSESEVIAGKTYHIKLIIADDRNVYFDSAIFLEAGSFESKVDLGVDRQSSTNNPMCYGEEIILDTKLPTSYTYEWYKDGIKDNSATSPAYTVKETGTYRVNVIMTPSTCVATDEIKIEYTSEIILKNATIVQCDIDSDGFTSYNLTKADAIIKNNDTTLKDVVYYESQSDAEAKLNPITNPKSYTNKQQHQQTLYARVENQYGCAKYAELELKIANNIILTQNPISVCDEDTDGIYQFNLDSEVTPQLLNGLPTGLLANYYLNNNDAITETNPLPNNFKNTTAFKQTIYARIINGPDCYAVTPIELIINTFDPANFGNETDYLCKDATINLSVTTGFKTYLWNTGSTLNTIPVNTPGNYSVTVSDINGCEKTKKFTIIPSDKAVVTGTQIKDFAANDNSVLIEYTGIGNYQFSLDNTTFQDNPLFTRVPAGIYYAYVKDKNGCGTTTSSAFYVLDYPRFFTPNGDGYNDLWRIKNLDQLPDYSISIFDRYGKLLKQMNSLNIGWDGTYGGRNLPSDDYWFTLIFVDGQEVKGHFSLKR
ncbi:T9SS type B sorting domain-containing protein [Flavobacterium sp. LS1R49]|uniref:T9SS type B sorting domain-containing protein n=1 Tax=Flavobacterium shii TaxID=2987687 RepID=A0A9X3C5C7_9FLAO|nr:T9SS type B sorting domain-containing protein [Flavobacterium shii]MCV9930104.1 T9SS type B sorting domain-containing protein [Flavobacterium shii]